MYNLHKIDVVVCRQLYTVGVNNHGQSLLITAIRRVWHVTTLKICVDYTHEHNT